MNPTDLFWERRMPEGRLITASRDAYHLVASNAKPIWEAHVFTKTHGHIWHGDLDLNMDEPHLLDITKQLGEHLYVMAVNDWKKVATHTVWTTDPNLFKEGA